MTATADRFVLIVNATDRPCNSCGEIHPYLSVNDERTRSCATPAIWNREDAETLTSFGPLVPIPEPLSPIVRR